MGKSHPRLDNIPKYGSELSLSCVFPRQGSILHKKAILGRDFPGGRRPQPGVGMQVPTSWIRFGLRIATLSVWRAVKRSLQSLAVLSGITMGYSTNNGRLVK